MNQHFGKHPCTTRRHKPTTQISFFASKHSTTTQSSTHINIIVSPPQTVRELDNNLHLQNIHTHKTCIQYYSTSHKCTNNSGARGCGGGEKIMEQEGCGGGKKRVVFSILYKLEWLPLTNMSTKIGLELSTMKESMTKMEWEWGARRAGWRRQEWKGGGVLVARKGKLPKP